MRMGLDGSNPEQVASLGDVYFTGLAVDPANGRVYYLDDTANGRFIVQWSRMYNDVGGQQTFEAIRGHFAGPDGMFRKLFGGGSADIMLVPEEDGSIDWLESGIEIAATDPAAVDLSRATVHLAAPASPSAPSSSPRSRPFRPSSNDLAWRSPNGVRSAMPTAGRT